MAAKYAAAFCRISSWLNLVERWFAELTTKKLHGVDPISLTS